MSRQAKYRTGQTFIEGALILTVAAMIVKIAGAIYKIPMISIIGTDGNGFYTHAYDIYLPVYAIAVSGFPTAISKIVSGLRSEGRYADIRRTRIVASRFLSLVGLAGTALLMFAAYPYAEYMISTPRTLLSVLAVAPSILFSCMISSHRGYSQGMSDMTPTAFSQVLEVLVKIAVGLGGSYLAKSLLTQEFLANGTVLGEVIAVGEKASVVIESYAAAAAIFGVTVSVFISYLYFKIRAVLLGDGLSDALIESGPKAVPDRELLREILRVSFPIALSSVVVYLAGFIDSFTISNRLIGVFEEAGPTLFTSHGGLLELAGKSLADDPAEVANYLYGVYGLGSPLFNLIPSLTGAFGMSAMPHVSASWQKRDRVRTKKETESVLRLTLLVAAPAGIGISVLSKPITELLYAAQNPHSAQIAYPMVAVLGIAAVFVAITSSVNALLQAVGRIDVPVKLMALGAAIKVLVNYFFVGIPQLNVKAVPYGNLCCYATLTVLGLAILVRSCGIRLSIGPAIFKPTVAAFACGAFARLAFEVFSLLFDPTSKLVLILSIGFGGVVYVVALGMLRALCREDVLGLPAGRKIEKVLDKLHFLD